MVLVKNEPDLTNLYFEKRSSPSGLVNMAIYPVIFGWRVRGWLSSNFCCSLDWCAGDSQGDVERLYSILFNILSHREEDTNAFNDLPMVSSVKPYFNDDEFVVNVMSKVTAPFELIKLHDIHTYRANLHDAEFIQQFNKS